MTIELSNYELHMIEKALSYAYSNLDDLNEVVKDDWKIEEKNIHELLERVRKY